MGERALAFLNRYAEIWLALIVLVVALALAKHEPPMLISLREAVFDTYQRWQPRPYAPSPVCIIDIDDESLTRIGQWPWPRTQVAELVVKLRDLGVAVIAFDILFVTTRHGVYGKELQCQLGVTYKTAWRMGHQIRDLMGNTDGFAMLQGHIELDEAYVGGRRPGKPY